MHRLVQNSRNSGNQEHSCIFLWCLFCFWCENCRFIRYHLCGAHCTSLVFGVVHIDANQIYYKMLKGRLTREMTHLPMMSHHLGRW